MSQHSKSDEASKAVDYKVLKISSHAFRGAGMIPAEYTCDGKNNNPPLDIEDIPQEAQSLAVIVEDPDAPSGTFTHWLIWDIPVTHHIYEGHAHGKEGRNDFRKPGYGGPCPPSGTHHYVFKVYALDTILNLPEGAVRQELEKAMSDHIIAYGEITALYRRKG